MLKRMFERTRSRDEILGAIYAALQKNDESAVTQEFTTLVTNHAKDPEIESPLASIVNYYASRQQPYMASMLSGLVLTHTERSSRIFDHAMDAYYEALTSLNASDPVSALMGYGAIMKNTAPQSPYHAKALEQIAVICTDPHLLDTGPLIEGLLELAQITAEDSPERHTVQHLTLTLADVVSERDPLGAMDVYANVLEDMQQDDPRKNDLLQKLLPVTEIVARRNPDNAADAIGLLIEYADDNSITRNRAFQLKKLVETISAGEDFSKARPLAPRQFALLCVPGIKPENP